MEKVLVLCGGYPQLALMQEDAPIELKLDPEEKTESSLIKAGTSLVHMVKKKPLKIAFFYDKEVFVIGGESIYHQFMDEGLVDEMRLTIVNDETEGDVYFPEFNEDDWSVYYKSMAQVSSYEGVDKSFYFEILKRKNG